MEHSGGQGIRVATWNVEWAARAHRDAITARLASVDADVLVVTEGLTSVLPTGGHHALGDANWGIPGSDPQRRKVLLWSRFPAHPSRGCRRGLNPPVSSRLLAM